MVFCSACNLSSQNKNKKLKVAQVRAVAELGTYDLYYHNIAKFDSDHWYTFIPLFKDTKFWIEYDSKVTVGVDLNKLKVEIVGDKVKINEPKARVLDVKIEKHGIKDDSVYCHPDSVKPTTDEQNTAIAEAQKNLKKEVGKEKVLLEQAEKRAKKLITDYVTNIGKVIEKNYVIEWQEE